ncbi:hypothetical protein EVG20_g9309 [Dentipellis fragilis]|uniref:F-box domain-containing protein n=1 Tax=Dentipellis fragilis TaxID=205917 RepID=A0A4Y9Y3V4_9AGAM|nr:hypothetical protein EVG20_g9309 [Dentipellis fragilis]
MEALNNLDITSQILPLLRKGRGADGQDPDHCFAQYALVNKTWLTVSRRELYRDVYLNISNKRRGTMHQFCETITKSPHLASLVRSINFVAGSLRTGETSDLAQAIALLPNLTGVKIYGWHPDQLHALALVLKSSTNLETLELSPDGCSEKGFTPLYTMSAFLEAMRGWTKLRTLEEAAAIKKAKFETTCPDLRRLELHYRPTDPPINGHLSALSKIAPTLSELCLRDSPPLSGEILLEALQAWAPTLTELRLDFCRIHFSDDFEEQHHLDDILISMPELRTLVLSSRYIRPSSLVAANGSFAKLETLIYDMH